MTNRILFFLIIILASMGPDLIQAEWNPDLPPNILNIGTFGDAGIGYVGAGLNNHLQVVGTYAVSGSKDRGSFVWSPDSGISYHSILDFEEGMETFSFDGVESLVAEKINNQGHVAGTAQVYYREEKGSTRQATIAYRFTPHLGVEFLEKKGVRHTQVHGFNDSGAIVGQLQKEGHSAPIGFIWNDDSFREFGLEHDYQLQRSLIRCTGSSDIKVVGARVDAINNAGHFVGVLYLNKKNPYSSQYHHLGSVAFYFDSDLHLIPHSLCFCGDVSPPLLLTDDETVLVGVLNCNQWGKRSYYTWSLNAALEPVPGLNDALFLNEHKTILGRNLEGEYQIWHNGQPISIEAFCGLIGGGFNHPTNLQQGLHGLDPVALNDFGDVLLNARFWFGNQTLISREVEKLPYPKDDMRTTDD